MPSSPSSYRAVRKAQQQMTMDYAYALGSVLVRDGHLADGLGVLDRASGHPAVFIRHLIRRQLEEAGQALTELLEQHAEKADGKADTVGFQHASELAVELGLRMVTQGDLVAAKGVWRLLAARGHPRAKPEALAYLAIERELTGDRDGALRAWQQTTAPAGEAWLRFGMAARVAGDIEAARWVLARASEWISDHDGQNAIAAADAAYRLGFLEYENGNPLAALRAFVTTTDVAHLNGFERAGDAAGNAHALARELHESGAHEQAAVGLTELAENGFRRTAVDLGQEFGQACVQADNPGAAAYYFAAITEYGASVSAAWAGLDLGRAMVKLDDQQRAHEVFAQVGQSGVDDAAGIADFELYCLLDESDPEQARKLLHRMGEDPNHVLADKISLLIGLAQDAEPPDAALATFEQAAHSGDPTGMFFAAQKLHEQGETERAAELYRQVVETGGDLAGYAALSLGAFAQQAGDLAQARAWWLPAVDDARAGDSIMMNLAMVAKGERDLAEAKHWFERVMAADTDRRAECAAHIGDMCYGEGKNHQAVEWYRITLDGSEEPELVGEAAYRTGEYLADSGESEAARTILIRAVEVAFEPFASSASELLRKLADPRSTAPTAPSAPATPATPTEQTTPTPEPFDQTGEAPA